MIIFLYDGFVIHICSFKWIFKIKWEKSLKKNRDTESLCWTSVTNTLLTVLQYEMKIKKNKIASHLQPKKIKLKEQSNSDFHKIGCCFVSWVSKRETPSCPDLMSSASHCILLTFPVFLIILTVLGLFSSSLFIFFFFYNDKKNGRCLGCGCTCTWCLHKVDA